MMVVAELIAHLEKYPSSTQIYMYDEEVGENLPLRTVKLETWHEHVLPKPLLHDYAGKDEYQVAMSEWKISLVEIKALVIRG
jgi:hypothetical protein